MASGLNEFLMVATIVVAVAFGLIALGAGVASLMWFMQERRLLHNAAQRSVIEGELDDRLRSRS